MADCLCYIRGDLEIVYCPLHEAAPDLLEAAKLAHEWIARVSNQYILGADDPHEVLAKLNRVLNPGA